MSSDIVSMETTPARELAAHTLYKWTWLGDVCRPSWHQSDPKEGLRRGSQVTLYLVAWRGG